MSPDKRVSELQKSKRGSRGKGRGSFWQGTLRVNRYNTWEAWVASESVGQDILVSGRVDMNRAFDGDAVAVELLSESLWRAPAGVWELLLLADLLARSMFFLSYVPPVMTTPRPWNF